MGCHFLLQGIFPTQGSNPRSPALQEDALPSEPPGEPQTTTEEEETYMAYTAIRRKISVTLSNIWESKYPKFAQETHNSGPHKNQE